MEPLEDERPAGESKKTEDIRRLRLQESDLEGLPPELMAELRFSDSQKLEIKLRQLIQANGGTASLDILLVDLYKSTGIILKRANLNVRLYNMTRNGTIFCVGKRGIYSSTEEQNT
jgi:hypothetical protein